jgi:hypothetical protein
VEIHGKPADDRLRDVAACAVPVEVGKRLVLLRAPQCHARGLLEPFRPEVRRHAVRPPLDLAWIAFIYREGDEAETGVADADVVDVEVELARDPVGDVLGEHDAISARLV